MVNGDDMAAARPATALFRTTRVLRSVPTPCYLPPSVLGNVPHLTPDNCAKVSELKAQTIDFADISPVAKLVATKQKNLRAFLNTRDLQLMLSARDYVSNSNPPSTRSGFMIRTPNGRRVVTPDEFMDVANQLEPELVVPLADEISPSLSRNRQRASVQSSLEWLDACLEKNDAKSPMCGVVVGGNDADLRHLSATETSKRPIQAVVLSGLDACEDLDLRAKLTEASVSALADQTIPRILTGVGHPLQVLAAVASGVDAFVSPFPDEVTREAAAMSFWIESGPTDDGQEREAVRESHGALLHLREKRFERDFGPLLPGCDCFACANYTRAYVHHLLNVREMLGDMLLYLHNLQHYYSFFGAVRRAIDAGTFTEYRATFEAKYSESKSTAPPLAVPLLIAERKHKRETERAAAIADRDAKRQRTE